MTIDMTKPTPAPTPTTNGAANAATPADLPDAQTAEEPATGALKHDGATAAKSARPPAATQVSKASRSERLGALPVSIADIWRARDALRGSIAQTPLVHSRTFSAMTNAEVYLKAEMLQRSGSFKIRGATYKMSRLSAEQRQHGVITASAGNHAQGVAIAARDAGVPCTIFMPRFAPLAKVTATQSYGAQVVLHGDTYDDAYARCMEVLRETGATYIPAFDDVDVLLQHP